MKAGCYWYLRNIQYATSSLAEHQHTHTHTHTHTHSLSLSLSLSALFGRGLDVKKHICLSITLVNKEFYLWYSLFLSLTHIHTHSHTHTHTHARTHARTRARRRKQKSKTDRNKQKLTKTGPAPCQWRPGVEPWPLELKSTSPNDAELTFQSRFLSADMKQKGAWYLKTLKADASHWAYETDFETTSRPTGRLWLNRQDCFLLWRSTAMKPKLTWHFNSDEIPRQSVVIQATRSFV